MDEWPKSFAAKLDRPAGWLMLGGLVAAALTTRGLRASGSRWPGGGTLGAALFVVAVADLSLYTMHWAVGDNATPLLPAIQKVGLFLLLGWMNGVALRVMRSG